MTNKSTVLPQTSEKSSKLTVVIGISLLGVSMIGYVLTNKQKYEI